MKLRPQTRERALTVQALAILLIAAIAVGCKGSDQTSSDQAEIKALKAEVKELKAEKEKAQMVLNQGAANTNARALATAVQAKAISAGKYDDKLSDYVYDMGGTIPINPCTGTATGYKLSKSATTAEVSAEAGTLCGTWTPMTFSLTL